MATTSVNTLLEVAERIREMREICGITPEEMAAKTEVSPADYLAYEAGEQDFPFTFIHKCALAFGIGITDLLEGKSAHLSSYTVTRKGEGQRTAREDGIEIRNLAPLFRQKIAEPYWVRYEFDRGLQDKPIHLTKHSGQEFDIVMSGRLKVQIGENIEYLGEGDSIYYNSSTPHGMIAVDGQDCLFVAVVLPGEDVKETVIRETIASAHGDREIGPAMKFIDAAEDENGALRRISFKNTDTFNFAFDIVDEMAKIEPDRLAMLHLDRQSKSKINQLFPAFSS